MISVIVPTYRESKNITLLADAVEEALRCALEDYELLFVDDDSQDGSQEICANLSRRLPVHMVVRKGQRGLATAVMHGIAMARGEIIVVMDADLSHPPSAMLTMVNRLRSRQSDFVLGSRCVEGASIHGGWSLYRKLNSAVPSLLCRPLFPVKDPVSGYFAFRRADMPPASVLRPIGYKIALEIFVKGQFCCPSEVPIHFAARKHGQSKLSLKEQLQFIQHLGRLFLYTWRSGRSQ